MSRNRAPRKKWEFERASRLLGVTHRFLSACRSARTFIETLKHIADDTFEQGDFFVCEFMELVFAPSL
jgi:hypothetical protein